MKKLSALFLVVCSLPIPNSSWAWGSASHVFIAVEAFRQMSPQLRDQTSEVLQDHPEHSKL